MKKFILSIAIIIFQVSSAFAIPYPPAKGQWAYPLESQLAIYNKADRDSNYQEVEMPAKWINAPSAVRDKDNYLWYRVKVGKISGWLPQEGIRLNMGSKSKTAGNIYNRFAKMDLEMPFSSNESEICSKIFKFNIIGMSMTDLRKKMGTPTLRESPYDNADMSILSYEVPGKNITVSIVLTRDYGDFDGKVESISIYQGSAGEPD